MEFAESPDIDNEWNGGFEGRFQKKDLVAVVISISKTIKSIMTYQKSLSALVEEVSQGSDQALFDAVRIDRTIMACTPVRHRISIAEMKNDQKFFLRLKKSPKGPSKKHMVALEGFDVQWNDYVELHITAPLRLKPQSQKVIHTIWPWPVSPMTEAGFVIKNIIWSKVKMR